MGEEKELWCPAAREKAGKKRENLGRAGHRRRKRSLWCPAVREKTGKKRENLGRAGHGEQKEALIPRLPSIGQPEIRELLYKAFRRTVPFQRLLHHNGCSQGRSTVLCRFQFPSAPYIRYCRFSHGTGSADLWKAGR